ncbi:MULTISPECIES: hypothetical protein [Bartonella]|nr:MULTISPECIES: hypothetical protein [Bartonella]
MGAVVALLYFASVVRSLVYLCGGRLFKTCLGNTKQSTAMKN